MEGTLWVTLLKFSKVGKMSSKPTPESVLSSTVSLGRNAPFSATQHIELQILSVLVFTRLHHW